QGDRVGGLRGAQRAGAQLLVLEHLGVAQGDLGARGTRDREAQPAHQVLTEVEEGLPGRRGPDLLRAPGLVAGDQRRGLLDEGAAVDLDGAHRSRVPGGAATAAVLAAVDGGEGERRTGWGPGLVGDGGLAGSVLEGGDEGGGDGVLLAVVRGGVEEPEVAVPPAATQHRRELDLRTARTDLFG